jgi:uncharacterized OB-fold protein
VNSDWTDGTPRVLVSVCDDCAHRWYLRRDRCPRCAGPVSTTAAAARGVVVGVTSGERGAIALVDLVDGIRVLARCDPALEAGSPARLTFRAEADDPVAVPFLEVESP